MTNPWMDPRLQDLYLRVQPAGLEVAGHQSTTSEGALMDGVFAFGFDLFPVAFAHYEGYGYGDEILLLSCDDASDPGDLEGYLLEDPKILYRFSWQELAEDVFGPEYLEEWRDGEDGQILFDADCDEDDLFVLLVNYLEDKGLIVKEEAQT